MEDAHIFATNIDGQDVSVFGVFDGHGGKRKTRRKAYISLLKNKER